MLGNDPLYFAIILLTPSATRIIMLGSPNDSPSFGHKRKFTIHISLFTCHYSPVTIHGYYSLLLFTQLFRLFKGGCPLYSSKCLFKSFSSDFFLRERLPLRAFLCKNISLLTLHTSYLLYLHFLLYKACNS